MQVHKRDGRTVPFERDKITQAVLKAFNEVDGEITPDARRKASDIAASIAALDKDLDVEEIQDLVEDKLMASKRKDVSRKYIRYRYKKELARNIKNTTDDTVLEMLGGNSEYWNRENSNKDAFVATVQRDYLAGITSTDLTRRILLPEHIVKAHDEGILHFHDADYFAEKINNCCLINLDDMLQNGTVINKVMIEKPHRFLTACTIATQIITAVASSQYGGCSISTTSLAPFVRSSYELYYKKYKDRGLSENQCREFAQQDTKKEVSDGVQTFNYQVNSMSTTNGQAPFLSVCMYLGETDEYKEELAMIIEEFLNQRIVGMKNSVGVYVTQAFPKLLYVLEEDNIHPDSKYWYLTELAAKCTAKRMVPDYISEKIMKELKINENGEADCYPCMGCRSFLTPDSTMHLGNIARAKNYVPNKGKYYGRFNMGVVTINLPDVALSAKKKMIDEGITYIDDEQWDKIQKEFFWEIYDERLELCHEALYCRYKHLIGTLSDIAPILWQDGAFARLNVHEPIDELLKHGYATISLGYAGLYECVKVMTGHSHIDGGEGEKFGLAVMQHLNDKCAEWRAKEDIAYSPYGSPIESTTYRFASCLKRRFGDDVFVKIDGHDRDYITNSYHCAVFEGIDPFEKLRIESKFQKLSPGGAISYVESSDLTNNIPAVLKVIQFIYDNIMYAELNTKSDYCQVCGYDGEIKIIDEDGELIWECPNCGNRDQTKMNVARRTCGYIGTNFWNKGRTDEITHRYVHLTDINKE